jgi:hypothetical protein
MEVDPAGDSPRTHHRLRLIILQETPGVWVVRGLEHDVAVEGRSIGTAVRAAVDFVEAHTAFDHRHDLMPLCAFPPSPAKYWNAYVAGSAVALSQLGIVPPAGWEICAAVAHRRP